MQGRAGFWLGLPYYTVTRFHCDLKGPYVTSGSCQVNEVISKDRTSMGLGLLYDSYLSLDSVDQDLVGWRGFQVPAILRAMLPKVLPLLEGSHMANESEGRFQTNYSPTPSPQSWIK